MLSELRLKSLLQLLCVLIVWMLLHSSMWRNAWTRLSNYVQVGSDFFQLSCVSFLLVRTTFNIIQPISLLLLLQWQWIWRRKDIYTTRDCAVQLPLTGKDSSGSSPPNWLLLLAPTQGQADRSMASNTAPWTHCRPVQQWRRCGGPE